MKTMAMLMGLGLLAATGIAGADDGKAGAKDVKPVSVDVAKLPAAVQATITAQAAGGTVRSVEKELEDGVTSYVALIKAGNRKFEAEVAEDGTLIGTEEPVKLADVPEPVRKTIAAKLAGRKLKELEKRVEKDKTFFEFVIKGEKGEIAVAADGTLMPSKAEREAAGHSK